jgi:hypothetical protein
MNDSSQNPEHDDVKRGDGLDVAQPVSSSSNPFSENQALALSHQADVSADVLTRLSRDSNVLKSRKVALALAMHARTPRHVSIPLLRRLFTFDLMQVSLTPAVAADIKRAAEDQILLRLESLSIGEKTALARRASGRVAAALLQEPDERVSKPALDNSQLTEAHVIQALMKPVAPEELFLLVCRHSKWSQRHEVQAALLRSEKTPPGVAAEFLDHFSTEALRQMVPEPRLEQLLTTRHKPR